MIVGEGADLFLDFADGDRVDASEGFVEHDEFWVIDEASGDFESSFFSARDAHGGSMADFGESELIEKNFEPVFSLFACVVLAVFENGHEVLLDGELSEDGGVLWEVAHSESGALVHGEPGDVVALEVDGTAVGVDETDGHPEAGGFSGPVWPEQSDDFASVDLKFDTVDDLPSAVPFLEVFDFKHGLSGGHGGAAGELQRGGVGRILRGWWLGAGEEAHCVRSSVIAVVMLTAGFC